VSLRQIAGAGNAAALVLLAAFLVHARFLVGPEQEGAAAHRRLPGPAPAGRVLLVVIDALREDVSRSMPSLNRLSGRGTARVESWVPSTVAGIRAIAEGVVPAPASFLHDFGTSSSRDGGIFVGLRAFAAGPRLWADLYGPWLAGAESIETVMGDDERVLRAGLAALTGGYDLVVVHFNELDDAAHRGGDPEAVVRRTDAALGRLIARAGPETAILVTSDHGVTHRGGHAGPEPEVVEVPVAVGGPGMPRGDLGNLRQRDLHRLLLAPLGRALTPPAQSLQSTPVFLVLVVLAVLWTLFATQPAEGLPTLLNASLWAALALSFLGFFRTALAVILLALAAGPRRRPALGTVLALGTGFTFGWLRLLDSGPAERWIGLAAVCALGLGLGWSLRRLPPLQAGTLCGLLPAALLRLMGETVSLSTLDVRLAFRVVDGPLGLAGAVAIVLLLQALPCLALIAGSSRKEDPFVQGMAAALAGQAMAGGIALSFASGPLALGLLVRLVGEVSFLFLAQAARWTISAPRGHSPLRKDSAAGKNSRGRSM
jgi:hypothetical protein